MAVVQGETTQSGNLIIPNVVVDDETTYTVLSIFENAFANCSGLTSITIPNTVAYIAKGAFSGCNNLISMELSFIEGGGAGFGYIFGAGHYTQNENFIPESLKTVIIGCQNIDIYTFYHCKNLTSVTILNSVTSINNRAFEGCTGLTSITIPNSVTSIGDNVFLNCSNLQALIIENQMPPQLSSTSSLQPFSNIHIPCGSLNNYKIYQYWREFNKYVEDFQYKISVQSEDEEKGNVEITSEPYCGNSEATIKATAKSGYVFYQWNDGNTDNPRSINVVKDTTIIAQFVPDDVILTLSSSNAAQGAVSNASGTYHYGDDVEIYATANYGYHFAKWDDGSTVNPRTVTITKDTVIKAEFAINQYTITLNTNIAVRGTVSGGGEFDYLSNNSISATPNEGYVFDSWSDDVTDNPRTIKLTSDTTFTAVFVPAEYDLVVTSANTALGSVTGSGTIKYKEKAIISAAVTAAHYHFNGWTDGNRQNPRTVQVLSDTQFVATFAIDSFNIAATSNNEELGIVTGGGLIAYGTAVEVKALPQPHCHFVEWSNGASGLSQQFEVEKDTAFNAAFAIDTHSLLATVADSTMGVATGSGTYDYGTAVTLTATAAAGCYFTGWSDSTTANPRIITIESDTTVVANFEKIQEFSITVVPSDTARGTVSGSGKYVSGTEATLSATPRQHYLFSQWSDGRTDNPRTVRVIADATYKAVFVPEQYNVVLSQNNADMGMVSGSGVYSYGDMVSCLAKPYQNYHFVQWSNGETANPYEFVIEGNQLLTAYFAAGAVTGIEEDAAAEPIIYIVGKTIVVENATNEILVYDAMGKLVCRDAIHRVRSEITVSVSGIYVVKVGNTVKRVAVESN
ncbi:MAG: leucine-rich repeat domain-containing protein [Salinivirgaceae bacterium]|nr:leucine-rich repeat domain-containing protein [Salinivirgaceae bacterium]